MRRIVTHDFVQQLIGHGRRSIERLLASNFEDLLGVFPPNFDELGLPFQHQVFVRTRKLDRLAAVTGNKYILSSRTSINDPITSSSSLFAQAKFIAFSSKGFEPLVKRGVDRRF